MKVGRNELCPCGSKVKYKRCCEERDKTIAAQTNRAHAQNHQVSCVARHYGDMDEILDGLGIPNDPSQNSPEFEALNDWTDEYQANLSENHPFYQAISNTQIPHIALIELAEKNGWTDYSERARVLYSAWVTGGE